MNARSQSPVKPFRALAILYFGPVSGTCLDRANALRRLGHDVHHVDLRTLLPGTPWVDRITWRLGGNLVAPWAMRGLRATLAGRHFDVCHVDGGEWVTPGVMAELRRHTDKIISYSIDDPLGPRDGARFKAFRQSLPLYDLNAVVREENVAEAKKLGARAVVRVYRSADEVSHAPRPLTDHDHHRWDTDVLFLGTWFPERGPFLLELIRLGVPLAIQGPHWHKAPEWPHLKSHWKGGAISGDDYAKAIQCAKVNLGLLSRENRDLHTTRSLEIPALGALLCAERTSEHVSMYNEGHEALFWKDARECAAMCHLALENESRRREIAEAGHLRVRKNGHHNQPVLASLMAAAGVPA
jgi:spore maturation protein CgeB